MNLKKKSKKRKIRVIWDNIRVIYKKGKPKLIGKPE